MCVYVCVPLMTEHFINLTITLRKVFYMKSCFNSFVIDSYH